VGGMAAFPAYERYIHWKYQSCVENPEEFPEVTFETNSQWPNNHDKGCYYIQSSMIEIFDFFLINKFIIL
jgi:hypothetical protein